MNSLSGFVKLHRKLIAWGWYQDYVVKDVFLHLLLTANFKKTKWRGRELDEGQVVIGYQKLSDELGFGVQRIRTALNKLKSTNEITLESTSRYTVVTIVNWREYQSADEPINMQTNTNSNKQLTNNQQTTNKQLTNNQQQRKNGKNVKNDKNGKNGRGTRTAHGEFQNVFLSDSELSELKTRYPDYYEAKIERLSRYLASTGKKYHDHYATLIDWLQEDAAQEQPKSKSSYDVNELEKIDTLDWIE